MPIVQPKKRDAIDDFLDAPPSVPDTAPVAQRSPVDAFLDVPPEQGPPVPKNVPGTVAFGAQATLEKSTPRPPGSAPQKGGIAHAVGQWWDQVNPMGIVKAAADFLPREPKDLLVSRPVREAWEAGKNLVMSGAEDLGAGDTSRGIRKMISGVIPVIGPSLNKAGEQVEQGDISGAVGTTAGIATNLGIGRAAEAVQGAGLPKGIRGAADRAARYQYQGALKPAPSTPPAEVANAVDYGLRNKFSPSRAGLEAHYEHMSDLQNAVSDLIDSTGPTRQISPNRLVKYTKDLESEYQLGGSRSTTNPEDFVPDVERVREGVLNQLRPTGVPGGAVRNMTAREAQNMKIGTARGIRESYGKDVKPATPIAQKAVVRALKDDVNAAFPEVAGMNLEESAGFDFEPLIERRVANLVNNQRPSLGTAAAGGIAQAATGSRGLAATVGFIKEIWNPTLKTQLAYALHRASKGSISLPAAEARVAGYVNALGQSVSPESGQPPESPASQ